LGVKELPTPKGLEGGPKVLVLSAWMAVGEEARREARARGREVVEGTGVVMGLVRLERVATDVVVCVNVPRSVGQSGGEELGSEQLKALLGPAMEMAEEAIGNLQIKDWGLFGES
jgi:hypothetical protein